MVPKTTVRVEDDGGGAQAPAARWKRSRTTRTYRASSPTSTFPRGRSRGRQSRRPEGAWAARIAALAVDLGGAKLAAGQTFAPGPSEPSVPSGGDDARDRPGHGGLGLRCGRAGGEQSEARGVRLASDSPRTSGSELRLKQIHDEMVSILRAARARSGRDRGVVRGREPTDSAVGRPGARSDTRGLRRRRRRLHRVPAATVKQAVCGYGRADKAQVQRMVRAILRLETRAPARSRLRRAGGRDLPCARLRRCPRRLGEGWSVIARLRGRPVAFDADGLVLDVNGVGYRLLATASALRKADGQEEVTLETHLYVREDALQLFGFATARSEQLFEQLQSVAGIGPKVALAIVSAYAPADLRRAIASGTPALFQSIPGIGRKLAQRVVLELKEKIGLARRVRRPAGSRRRGRAFRRARRARRARLHASPRRSSGSRRSTPTCRRPSASGSRWPARSGGRCSPA